MEVADHSNIQPAPASAQIGRFKINYLGLVEEVGQVPSFGEIRPFGEGIPVFSDLDTP
jgi:hypothetical protein